MTGRLSDLTGAERRRAFGLAIAKVSAVWVALFRGYYLAPVSLLGAHHALVFLIVASTLFMIVVAWQVRRIGRTKLPAVEAVQALGLLIPFFLVLFASFYLSFATGAPRNFSQLLNHTVSLYFTVTVFATVGFGDIVPLTALARLVVAVKMLLDLVVLGAVVRIVLFAARRRIEE